MTKKEIIAKFERDHWEFHEIYRSKLMTLDKKQLVDKLFALLNTQAITVFGGQR